MCGLIKAALIEQLYANLAINLDHLPKFDSYFSIRRPPPAPYHEKGSCFSLSIFRLLTLYRLLYISSIFLYRLTFNRPRERYRLKADTVAPLAPQCRPPLTSYRKPWLYMHIRLTLDFRLCGSTCVDNKNRFRIGNKNNKYKLIQSCPFSRKRSPTDSGGCKFQRLPDHMAFGSHPTHFLLKTFFELLFGGRSSAAAVMTV